VLTEEVVQILLLIFVHFIDEDEVDLTIRSSTDVLVDQASFVVPQATGAVPKSTLDDVAVQILCSVSSQNISKRLPRIEREQTRVFLKCVGSKSAGL
jgi:hypothetical protein